MVLKVVINFHIDLPTEDLTEEQILNIQSREKLYKIKG